MKLKFFVISILLIVSCTNNNKEKMPVETNKAELVSNTLYNTMGPYFSSSDESEIILSWTEEIDSSYTNILKYKIYNTQSKRFGETKEVAPSIGMQAHEESMAKVAKTAKGVLYAIFRFKAPTPKNRFAGSIFYAISTNNGETWSEKKKLVADASSQSQSFFDVALLPNGELGMSWLDNRKLEKDKDGSTLYFAQTRNDEGFVNEKPIAGSTCQCCRTDIYISGNKQINVAFRNILNDSIRDMFITKSTNLGEGFSQPVRMGKDNWKIFGCPHTGPSLAYNGSDLSVAWYTGANSGKGLFFKKLTDEIELYETKTLVSPTGLHPQMIGLSNGKYYLVYEDFYTENNQTYNEIIINTINKNGEQNKKRITDKFTFNDHAVISKVDNNHLLIAWVNKVEGTSKVMYKLIEVE